MGELLALASALTYSMTAVVEKFWTRRVDPFYLASMASLGGALFMLVLMFGLGKFDDIEDAPVASIVMSTAGGVLSIGIGYSLYLVFLRSVDVSKAAPLSQGLFAVLAVVSGLFFLDESLSPLTLVGIFAVVCGLYLLSFAQRKQSADREARWLGSKGLAFMVMVASFWVAGFSLQKEALKELDEVIANGLRLPVVFLVIISFALLTTNRFPPNSASDSSAEGPALGRKVVGGTLIPDPLDSPAAISIDGVGNRALAAPSSPPGLRARVRKGWKIKRNSRLSYIVPILNGSISFGLGSLILLMALDRAGLAITMVLSNTSLLFIVLFSTIFLKERVTRKTVLGAAITIAGIVPVVV